MHTDHDVGSCRECDPAWCPQPRTCRGTRTNALLLEWQVLHDGVDEPEPAIGSKGGDELPPRLVRQFPLKCPPPRDEEHERQRRVLEGRVVDGLTRLEGGGRVGKDELLEVTGVEAGGGALEADAGEEDGAPDGLPPVGRGGQDGDVLEDLVRPGIGTAVVRREAIEDDGPDEADSDLWYAMKVRLKNEDGDPPRSV